MLTNDQIAVWDRENFFHPSTHLAMHARGETPTRVIRTGEGRSPAPQRHFFG